MEINNQQEEKYLNLEFNTECGKIALIYLTTILETDEIILEAIGASCHSTVGLLVATDSRLVYAGVSLIKESVTKRISYKNISSIDFMQSFTPTGEIIVMHNEKTVFAASPGDAKKIIVKIKEITGR
jgi:hypothetical protein